MRTLREWGEQWLDLRETDRMHRSVTRERSVWRCHVLAAPFADWPIERITRGAVVAWVDTRLRSRALTPSRAGHVPSSRPLSRSVVANSLTLLRRCLHAAADRELVMGNAAAGVEVPRIPRDEEGWTYLELEEIDRVLALPTLRTSQRAILSVAVYTGLRAGELWGLRWGDVRLTGPRPELHVCRSYRRPTKRGRTRHVPLLPQAREALSAWRIRLPRAPAPHALVFPADGGGCHHPGYDAGWPQIRAAAAISRNARHPVFHDLRHTCASHLVMGSWTRRALRLEEVRQWLGHSSVTVTERYAHLAADWLHDALE